MNDAPPKIPIDWIDAKVEGFGVFIAIAGGSTSGKTFTALRLARGLAGKEAYEARRVFVADTEGGRTSHYADTFIFKQYRMIAPFYPWRFSEVANDAAAHGAAVLVFDNFTLEWSGEGGVHDMFDKEQTRRYGDDEKKRKAGQQACWARVKPPHKAMMSSLLQHIMPIIFVLRAEEKTKPDAAGVPQNLGWLPIQDKRFIYEWTVSLTLHPDTPGKPRFDLPHKVEGQHRHLFPEGELIGEAAGEGLRQWSRRGVQPVQHKQTAKAAKKEDQAVAFADELIGQIGSMGISEIHAHLDDKKVKPRLERLMAAYPAENKRVEVFLNSRLAALHEAAEEMKRTQAESKAAEPSPDQRFIDETIASVRKALASDIDNLIKQAAIASKLRRIETADASLYQQFTEAVTARRAELKGSAG